jgi:Ala-tRNA(Pro) deacylase
MDSTLKQYLETNNIKYKLHKHPAVFTVEEHKNAKLPIPGMHTKSLFLKDTNNKFYLICMPGEKRLDIKFLKTRFSAKKFEFCSPEELLQELHVTPGSVSIFTMIYAKKTILLVDKDVWSAEIVGFHPNINTETLELTHNELEKFYNSLQAEKHIIELPDKSP